MSFKPKNRLSGNKQLNISGYNENFNYNYNYNFDDNDHYHNSVMTKKDKLIQKIRWKQLSIISLIILCSVHYFERLKPYYTMKSCMWNKWETWNESNAKPYHSIIIGDPQLVDDFSYPDRSSLALFITKQLSDNYLHRNHIFYSKYFKPDSIIFVGDLFDGGREWNDTQWLDEYHRFNKVFNPIDGIRQFRQVPGNHDVGFGNGISFEKYSRFKGFFGNADEVITIGNHSLVLMDTVSLSCTEDERINKVSKEFLISFEDPNNPYHKLPKILISHVPLYRFTELQTCDVHRESQKPFPVIRGKQYQTVIEYEISQRIINTIKPSLIFSGDDHDYCHIRHPYGKSFSKEPIDYEFKKDTIPGSHYCDEVTVKSSAMTGGISKPAIQLLSLWNPLEENDSNNKWEISNVEGKTVDSKTAITHLCYLPNPYQPLIHYHIILIMSILWIFLCTVKIDYGIRYHTVFQKYVLKLKKLILNLFRKDIKSMDMSHLNQKNSNKFNTVFEYIVLDWDIERNKDWKSFILNVSLVSTILYGTLFWYIHSI